jgi:tyrosyl-tRNA synthetase
MDKRERLAQRILAEEVTKFVHGEAATKEAKAMTQSVYSKEQLTWKDVQELDPALRIELQRDTMATTDISKLAQLANVANSRGNDQNARLQTQSC